MLVLEQFRSQVKLICNDAATSRPQGEQGALRRPRGGAGQFAARGPRRGQKSHGLETGRSSRNILFIFYYRPRQTTVLGYLNNAFSGIVSWDDNENTIDSLVFQRPQNKSNAFPELAGCTSRQCFGTANDVIFAE